MTKSKSAEVKVGSWAGNPNYECPFCTYATLNGPEQVEAHMVERHPDEIRLAALGLPAESEDGSISPAEAEEKSREELGKALGASAETAAEKQATGSAPSTEEKAPKSGVKKE